MESKEQRSQEKDSGVNIKGLCGMWMHVRSDQDAPEVLRQFLQSKV
ncbi:hypothetical protein [Metabacillus sp. 84]